MVTADLALRENAVQALTVAQKSRNRLRVLERQERAAGKGNAIWQAGFFVRQPREE